MRDAASSLNDRIAQRVRELRAERGLSLDALAARCDISRSMISLIERGESSPTAVLLEKLAAGLDVPPASLFDAPAPIASPVARGADAEPWRDPQSGYVRRNVSPSGVGSPIQIVEVSVPGRRARVVRDAARATPSCTSRSGCSRARSRSRWATSATGSAPATAWRWCSTQPIIFHNPHRRAGALRRRASRPTRSRWRSR